MSGPVQPPLTVETVDGATVGRPITTIKVTNGDLTISGATATIDTSGGGGGTGTVTSVGTSQAFITITDPTTTPSISIGNASGAATGVLTAANFNTFDAKQDAITLTTTGTSGAATFAGGTLNIPQYTDSGGTVTSVGTSQAFITITNPTTTPSISIGNASGAATGVLTASDWTDFDGKQDSITLTTTGSSGAATLVGSTLNIPQYSGGGGGGIGGSITDNKVAVGATTADEIEGYSDFTYNDSTDTLTVGEKIDSSGTSQLQLIAGSSNIAILDGGVANHINISPASGRINAISSTLSVGTNAADTVISSRGAYNLTLNTNDGTNSGTIVIEDSANGQISITPNGTGTIKLDGVELDNTAIATGYILKASSATAAGWVAESAGGGSTPKFSGVKANTNAYYDLSSYPTGWRTTGYSNISETQSAPIYSPFTCGIDLTLSTLGIEVSVAGDAGLNYLLAIYSVDAAGLPDSKLVSATASADATGTQTGTITETSAGDGDLVAGTQYYYAYTQSFDATSNPSLRSAGAQFHGAFTDTTIGTQRQAIRAGSLGTLPATYPGSGVVLGTSIAIVGCTYG